MRHAVAVMILFLGVGAVAPAAAIAPIVIGAVYPTGGGQGPGGTEEFRGVDLAADYANRSGGGQGRPIQLPLEHADSWGAAPFAVQPLGQAGINLRLGRY